jgi:two-component system, cell cycle sensor histidine kinase and response regulator CckA
MSKDLRSRAERRVRETSAGGSPGASGPSSADSQLLHDLQVHQIELEMQNEELRRTEVALEASRARYFDLYDVAPVGYFSISDAGLIVEANLTAATLLGVPRGTLVNQPVTRFIVTEDQDTYYLHRRRLLATGVPQVLELRLKKADGTQFWARFEATTAPGTDAGSEVCRTVVSDISDRKRHEEERLRFERELQQAQKMESLVRMAGAIAHHFNNQLGVVMGNLELSMVAPGVNADHLEQAMLATRRAAEVSGQLLTYLGQSSGDHAPLDLADTCRKSLPMLRAAMPVHVTLHVDLPAPGPAVNGNPAQLQLLLTNLVTNAWEAVGEIDSVVNVRVTTVRGKAIPAARRFAVGWKPRDQDYACLEVTDTGCGIDDQEIDKIFDPFFTSKFTGRGLGLPVVLGILHAHGGGLVVESRTGRQSRSTFRVYLPVSTEQVVRPAPEAAVDDRPEVAGGGTVLVVEDDDALRATTMATVTHLGFTTLGAKNGVEAIDVFRRHRDVIRLVVCDLTMPHMDGWQTLSALRGLSPALPVILTSGYDQAHVMAGDHDDKPEAFLEKPYPFDALRAAIRRALGSGRA